MSLTNNEYSKAFLTVVGSLSAVANEPDTVHDSIVFKMNDDADGPRGLYMVRADGSWELIGFGPRITVGATAPTSPVVGDIWVDTN